MATVGPTGSTRRTVPRAYRATCANGWKVDWRQAGPPGVVRIGAMTLTSWAWHAMPTRSACRSRLTRRLPTTTASVTVKTSSMSSGASRHSRPAWPPNRDWYQTFHSSKEIRSFRGLRSTAPTWSAVATIASMKRSMSTPEARKLSVSGIPSGPTNSS